jgi:transcriptional regulator with XRE-family HTH domain
MRLNRGLSLREAADAIGVERRVLLRAELGTTTPHPGNGKKIADFYDKQVTDLWPLEDEAAA